MNSESSQGGLLESLKAGKSAAFERLYKDYYKMIAKLIQDNKGTKDDAEDVFQETLIAFIQNIRKPDFELTAKIGTYLYSIARLKWLNRLRKSKSSDALNISLTNEKGTMVLEDKGMEEIAEKQEYEAKHILMAKVLKELKADCQQLLNSYYIKRLSLTEIAKAMDYTDAFIKVKKHRCMNAFKKKIEDNPDYKNLKN